MANNNISRAEIKLSQMDISCDSTTDTENYSKSVEMVINKSDFMEVRRLEKLFRRSVMDVYKTDECKDMMNFLRRFSSELLTNTICINVCEVADNDNCIEFFRQYVIIAIDNCVHMMENISQRQYINFIKFVMALWNMSDKFDSLCARMVAADVHIYLIRLLGKMEITITLLEIRQILLLTMSIVGILHNINRKLQYTRSQYRHENLVNYLMPLAALDISKDLISLKTAALLLLAFLVNENENSVLNANDDHIVYIVGILKATVTSPELYSRYYGYHCLEILHSLRHIASPDANKRSLINKGVLEHIRLVIEPENEERYPNEVIAALELLWSLSFHKECLQALDSDEHGLKNRVNHLAQHSNQNIILSARGILWNINSSHGSINLNSLMRSDARTPNINGHIMISYQHSTQDIMVRIKDKLIDNGYRVWMDVDHMRGSFVDAMAEGIQHAAVLLLGMCQAFKNSPHCRQEVKYAYILGIPLVPIMLEPGFTPDGWLGLMCAALIYTEFLDSNKFDQNIMLLQRQLGGLGHSKIAPYSNQDSLDGSYPINHNLNNVVIPQLSSHTNNNQAGIASVVDTSDLIKSFKSDHSSYLNNQNFHSELSSDVMLSKKLSLENSNADCYFCNQSELQIIHWSKAQCAAWFASNEIQLEKDSILQNIDGPLLLELAEMRSVAPEMFFKAAKEDLKLTFLDVLQLSRALRNLKKLS